MEFTKKPPLHAPKARGGEEKNWGIYKIGLTPYPMLCRPVRATLTPYPVLCRPFRAIPNFFRTAGRRHCHPQQRAAVEEMEPRGQQEQRREQLQLHHRHQAREPHQAPEHCD